MCIWLWCVAKDCPWLSNSTLTVILILLHSMTEHALGPHWWECTASALSWSWGSMIQSLYLLLSIMEINMCFMCVCVRACVGGLVGCLVCGCVCLCVCMGVCVCVCAHACGCVCLCVHGRVGVGVCVSVCAWTCTYACGRARVCVCVWEREREEQGKVFLKISEGTRTTWRTRHSWK